jgi:tetratricopeptide (TPR) repeat protein
MAKAIKRKKMTRHELKEDRFLESTKTFISFSRKNSSRIILVVIVLIIAAVVARLYISSRHSAEEQARLKKIYADALYENGNFSEAIPAYQEIIQLHGGTRTARVAHIFLANSYFFSGDNENALENYEKALKLLGKNVIWATAAEMGIGSVQEQSGYFEEAIAHYDNVISKYRDAPVRVDALLSKARCLEFLNRYNEAIRVYTVIEMDYPDTDFAEEAEKKIAFLRGAVESERIPRL